MRSDVVHSELLTWCFPAILLDADTCMTVHPDHVAYEGKINFARVGSRVDKLY